MNSPNDFNQASNRNITIIITISNLLIMNEAIKLLNIDETILHSLMAANEIPFKEIAGKLYFDEYELWDWMYKQNPPMIKNSNPQLNIFAN